MLDDMSETAMWKCIAELEADVARLREQYENVGIVSEGLKAENAELRKDAARYRWLRDCKSLEHGIFINLLVPTLDVEVREYLPAETDAAIDAAMGEQT